MFTLPGTNDWLFTGKVLNISCNESRSIITAVTSKCPLTFVSIRFCFSKNN